MGKRQAEAMGTRRFPVYGEAVPQGLKGYTHDVIPAGTKWRAGTSGDFAKQGLGLG